MTNKNNVRPNSGLPSFIPKPTSINRKINSNSNKKNSASDPIHSLRRNKVNRQNNLTTIFNLSERETTEEVVDVNLNFRLNQLNKTKQFYEDINKFDQVLSLVQQTQLYESNQQIERRIIENSIHFIPQVTLEINSKFNLSNQSEVNSSSTNKKFHVGTNIFEKFKSKVSKNVQIKSNNNNVIKYHPSNSTLNINKRFSKILGNNLENLKQSTRVVTMGTRLHILPNLPFLVIEEIYRRGMRTPGILRISGDLNRIDELIKLFEENYNQEIDLTIENIHTLCGLLKYYLRSLPEPLFPSNLSQLFYTNCVNLKSNLNLESKLNLTTSILHLIPSRSLSLLIYLIPFLSQIPTFPENRIQDESLATILGPAIFLSRHIGFPGLGSIHQPRSHKFSSLNQLNKFDLSNQVTKSTLWLMRNWKSCFNSFYFNPNSISNLNSNLNSIQNQIHSDSQIPLNSNPQTSIELNSINYNHSIKEIQNELTNFIPQQQQPTHTQPVHQQQQNQIHSRDPTQDRIDTLPALGFTTSRSSSILTYSSGLTGSQTSSQVHHSNRTSSFIQFQPIERDSIDLEPLTLRDSIRPNSITIQLKKTPTLLSYHCVPDQSNLDLVHHHDHFEPSRNDKELHSIQPQLTKLVSTEEESKEKRNSERFTRLISDYIDVREEKIIQQESLIQNLIEEIKLLKSNKAEVNADQNDAQLNEKKQIFNSINTFSESSLEQQPFDKIKQFLTDVDVKKPNLDLMPLRKCETAPANLNLEFVSILTELNQSIQKLDQFNQKNDKINFNLIDNDDPSIDEIKLNPVESKLNCHCKSSNDTSHLHFINQINHLKLINFKLNFKLTSIQNILLSSNH